MRRLRKWIPFLIVLFLSYYVGVTSFTHTHQIFNQSITHSHPYLPQSNGTPIHSHTDTILGTITLLNIWSAEIPQSLIIWSPLLLLFIFKLPQIQYLTSRPERENTGRAPPMYGLS